jgi:hypothetical protein
MSVGRSCADSPQPSARRTLARSRREPEEFARSRIFGSVHLPPECFQCARQLARESRSPASATMEYVPARVAGCRVSAAASPASIAGAEDVSLHLALEVCPLGWTAAPRLKREAGSGDDVASAIAACASLHRRALVALLRKSFAGPGRIWTILANLQRSSSFRFLAIARQIRPGGRIPPVVRRSAGRQQAGAMKPERRMRSQPLQNLTSTPAHARQPDLALNGRVFEVESHGVDSTPSTRHVRSLVLAWRDEVSGDELTVDVRGSQRFLEGLRPLGFVPLGEQPNEGIGQRLPCVHPVGENVAERSSATQGAPRRRSEGVNEPDSETNRPPAGPARQPSSEASEHHVRWTVRLSRPWNLRKS